VGLQQPLRGLGEIHRRQGLTTRLPRKRSPTAGLAIDACAGGPFWGERQTLLFVQTGGR